MGLYDDANITTAQFSNLALFFYVSYLILEFPHGYGMQRLPTAKLLELDLTKHEMIFVMIVLSTRTSSLYGSYKQRRSM